MARADINEHRVDTSAVKVTVGDLHPLIMDEIIWALRLKDRPLAQLLTRLTFSIPARKFTRIVVELENAVAEGGPAFGARKIFKYFFNDMQVSGAEQIPQEGPLILAANHPGGMESVAQISLVGRNDMRVISSDVNFLRPLPAVTDCLLPITSDVRTRFSALKEAVRHLEAGGCLLIYPSGSIDPEPRYFANAKDHIHRWSKSLEVFIKKVPQLTVVPIITSNVLHEKFLFNKLVMTQKYRMDRQRAAEFLQTLNMMFLKGRRIDLQMSIGKPIRFTEVDLNLKESVHQAKQQLQEAAEALFDAHIRQFPPVRSEIWLEKDPVFQHT
ncbi:MAG: 1-acyl-sn-glycerol-3-phosphate acyltransferase [Anaerolineae bacterium]|jgi:1-acyl-sn-glycerol-3-phosphate acyltransferase|nr:1-acyl-sn-glycerol-3-phosphate acyltransferase [Anaerolineae bacterium]